MPKISHLQGCNSPVLCNESSLRPRMQRQKINSWYSGSETRCFHILFQYSVAFITFVILFYKWEGDMTNKNLNMNESEWMSFKWFLILYKMRHMGLSAIWGWWANKTIWTALPQACNTKCFHHKICIHHHCLPCNPKNTPHESENMFHFPTQADITCSVWP